MIYPWWNNYNHGKFYVPHDPDDRAFLCILCCLCALAVPFIYIYFLTGLNPWEFICDFVTTLKMAFTDKEFWKWMFTFGREG